LPLKIQIFGRSANVSGEDLNFRAKIRFFSGSSKPPAKKEKVPRKKKKFRWKIAMFSRKSRPSAKNEVVGQKIKTAAEFLNYSLKIQKFS